MPPRFRLVASFAAALWLSGCSPDSRSVSPSETFLARSGGEPVPRAAPSTPIAGAPPGAVYVDGIVEAERIAGASFPVPGLVLSVKVKPGDRVQRGQLLAELHTEDRTARLEEFRAKLQSARASVPAGRQQGADGPPPDYLVEEIEAQRERAKELLENNAGEVSRVASTGVTDGERAAAELAIAIHRSRNDRPSTGAMQRSKRDALALALVDDLQTRVNQLENAIADSSLRSPIDGEVLAVSIAPELEWNTRSQQACVEVLDRSSLIMRVAVRDEHARRLGEGAPVWFATDQSEGRVLEGAVRGIAEEELRLQSDTSFDAVVWREVVLSVPASLRDTIDLGAELRAALPP